MSFDTRAFRHALGLFPTGVAVVTTTGPVSQVGITVNSFVSVSLDPPLVLWCIDKNSERYDAFTKADYYTVSILGTTQEAISIQLARGGAHQLAGVPLIPTESGPPALANALAVFECEIHAVHDGGDHAILVGRVLRFSASDAGAPLVFFRGKYGALASRD